MRTGWILLGMLVTCFVALSTALFITMTSSAYIFNPKTAILGLVAAGALVIEISVGMILQKRRGRDDDLD